MNCGKGISHPNSCIDHSNKTHCTLLPVPQQLAKLYPKKTPYCLSLDMALLNFMVLVIKFIFTPRFPSHAAIVVFYGTQRVLKDAWVGMEKTC